MRKGVDGTRYDPSDRTTPASVRRAHVPARWVREQNGDTVGRPRGDPDPFDARDQPIAFLVGKDQYPILLGRTTVGGLASEQKSQRAPCGPWELAAWIRHSRRGRVGGYRLSCGVGASGGDHEDHDDDGNAHQQMVGRGGVGH